MYKELQSKYSMPKRAGLFRTKAGSTWMIRGTPITEQEAYDLVLTHANRHFDTNERRVEDVVFLLELGTVRSLEEAYELILKGDTREWKPDWSFSDAGNMITVFWEETANTAKWLNPYVQIFYKHDEPKTIVGCQIYGVYQRIEHAFAAEARRHTELAVAVRKVIEASKKMDEDAITNDEFFDTIDELSAVYRGQ